MLLWPAQYIYVRRGVAEVRISRFTGVPEVSTPEGWERESLIIAKQKVDADRAAADAAKAPWEAAEARQKAEEGLSEPRMLGVANLGNHGNVLATCTTAYMHGDLVAQIILPYSTVKPDPKVEPCVIGPQFLSKGIFVVAKQSIPLSDFTRTVDEKGGYSAYQYQLEIPMSETDYSQISSWTASWTNLQ